MVYEGCIKGKIPFTFIPYIMKNNIHKHKASLWIKGYMNDENMNHIYTANRVIKKKSSNMPKFKFGRKIPNNPHHAYKSNKVNNDKGWETSNIHYTGRR